MQRMFDVGNSSHIGCWICAKDEAEALNVAVRLIRDVLGENGRISDVTERALQDDKTGTLKPILEGTKVGKLFFRGVSYSFSEMMKIRNGEMEERKPKGWELLEV